MIHVTVPLHVVPPHVSVPKTPPLPHSLIVARPTVSVADALTLMLLPVHTPLGGEAMLAVGGVVSPPPPPPLQGGAPDATVGEVPFLYTVTGADTAQFPATSVATACT